jgi:Mrp family chromosome partitioning ATPase
LIPRGSNVGHPGELYLGPAMEHLLKEVYAEYDYVIFDSSPVMVADDSTSVAPKIDATIFVVRFSNSSARRCRESIEMLKTRQANIIGVVCNAVPNLQQDYYGYAEYYTSAGKS